MGILEVARRIYQISRENCEEIGCDYSFPTLILHSVRKHTVRLAYQRKELDLRPDLDFSLLGRQAKSGRHKKGGGMIEALDYDCDHGLGYFNLLVMSFLRV